MNEILLYKWGIDHGVFFKGGKNRSQGYQGPTEAELAARRAEERANLKQDMKLARLQALEDQRLQAESDMEAVTAAKLEEARLIAEREKKEEMVGDESEAQADSNITQQADILSTGDRYGDTSNRPGGTRPTSKYKKKVTTASNKKPGVN
jgi:hypothetical protein